MIRKQERVVLADGDPTQRELAAAALRQAGYETIEVSSGVEAVLAAKADGVGLVVLEVELPGLSGYETCRELRLQHGEGLPIFFLSGTRIDPLDRVAGLLLGADDFIVKPFHPGELIARVGRVVGRGSGLPKPAINAAPGPRLTAREREILDLLANGDTQKEIAQDLTISAKTVGTHIQTLLVKFGLHSRAELVAHAYRQGIVSPLHDRRARTPAELTAVS